MTYNVIYFYTVKLVHGKDTSPYRLSFMAKNYKTTNPLWGGRFKTGVADLAQSFSASVDVDKRLAFADIQGSTVYAEVLNEAGLINSRELSSIKKGLNQIKKEIEQDKFIWDPSLEDVHMNIESRLLK